jgi:putative transposase
VFHKPEDYAAFGKLLGQAGERVPMRLLAWCLMPNHFHVVLWPQEDGDLGRWMQWLLTAHVRPYHRHYHSSGHVWQGRFKAFPIQQDEHLLTVVRYVERNPLRAGLVRHARDWRWSSASDAGGDGLPVLHPGPVARGPKWQTWVDRPITGAELAAVRSSIARGTPFGSDRWQRATAGRLGLGFTLHPRGRPRKDARK